MTQDIVVVCAYCGGPTQEFQTFRLGSQPGYGERRCLDCDALVGFWLDGGTLDLDAIRREGPPDPDFEVFPCPAGS